VYGGSLSRRGATRVHRVAWTVADLRGHDEPTVSDVEAAIALRTGRPLPLLALGEVG
jgi:magnesium chelatase family protein